MGWGDGLAVAGMGFIVGYIGLGVVAARVLETEGFAVFVVSGVVGSALLTTYHFIRRNL